MYWQIVLLAFSNGYLLTEYRRNTVNVTLNNSQYVSSKLKHPVGKNINTVYAIKSIHWVQPDNLHH
jgi:hypothetical protein